MKKWLKPSLCLIIPLIILFLPSSFFGLDGLTVVEQRVIALFFLAALCWILEPIPIYATSLLIIFLELVLISNKGLKFLIREDSPESFGVLLPFQSILATFASPIIILFLGGFFLAMAATKYRLDQNLAKVLLKPFGEKPAMVMLGLMVITAIFSMFMSNTATTAMMLSILVPVLGVFEAGDRGKIAFTLSIPLAANIGGIGTPIGTPPNAIALKYLTGADTISFGSWMMFGLPYVFILLMIGWLLLGFLYPSQTPKIELKIRGKFLKNPKAYIVYTTFALTILLWLTDFIHGMNAYVVALLPVAVFSATAIITKEDLKKISWDVLWLVSGGIALGLALDQSGLAKRVIGSIPFESFSPYLIVIGMSILATLMANFMSNTATANLLLPLVAALGASMASLDGLGGGQMLIVGVTIACSLGMALPISTPPNALAFGTGEIKTEEMAKIGIMMAVIGLIANFILLYILNALSFFA